MWKALYDKIPCSLLSFIHLLLDVLLSLPFILSFSPLLFCPLFSRACPRLQSECSTGGEAMAVVPCADILHAAVHGKAPHQPLAVKPVCYACSAMFCHAMLDARNFKIVAGFLSLSLNFSCSSHVHSFSPFFFFHCFQTGSHDLCVQYQSQSHAFSSFHFHFHFHFAFLAFFLFLLLFRSSFFSFLSFFALFFFFLFILFRCLSFH